jgi:hypothetical protein
LIVAANPIAPAPRGAASWPKTVVRMDSEVPRGSGGSLRDAVQGLDPTRRVLVVPGHSFPRTPLAEILRQLSQCDADVVVHADGQSVPTGLFLVRCGALALLPAKGFVDLKEQALPLIAFRAEVYVVRTDHPAPMPIRTLDGYINALRAAAAPNAPSPAVAAEEWRCTFALAEPGSEVHPTARLHDAIVLAGGRVRSGAVVVRSLVGPGGIVQQGEAIFDELVAPRSVPA